MPLHGAPWPTQSKAKQRITASLGRGSVPSGADHSQGIRPCTHTACCCKQLSGAQPIGTVTTLLQSAYHDASTIHPAWQAHVAYHSAVAQGAAVLSLPSICEHLCMMRMLCEEPGGHSLPLLQVAWRQGATPPPPPPPPESQPTVNCQLQVVPLDHLLLPAHAKHVHKALPAAGGLKRGGSTQGLCWTARAAATS